LVETNAQVKGGQAMSLQHSTEQRETQGEAKGRAEQEENVVPLDLGGLRILKQDLQEDGSIEVEVIATTERARCPHCQRVSVKVYDTRPRRKLLAETLEQAGDGER
jgi:hypothetical protein